MSSISNPPPPDPIVLSVANGLDAHISGLELELDHRLTARVGVFANTTHYFNRKERLASGVEQDILNVPTHTVRAGIDVDFGPLSGACVRPLRAGPQGQRSQPGRDSRSSTTTTSRSSTRASPAGSRDSMRSSSTMNNLFDEFYYEKLGYPLQGASFKASYRMGF